MLISTRAIAVQRAGIYRRVCFRRAFAWGFTAVGVAGFLVGRAGTGFLCFVLAPVALAILFSYSFAKRFTMFAHLLLGFCLGYCSGCGLDCHPRVIDWRICWLTAAVMFWTAGFDVIYACQDFEFDTAEGLFSIPRRFGIARALLICAVSCI